MSKSTAIPSKTLGAILAERSQAERKAAVVLVREHVTRQVNGTQSLDAEEAGELASALSILGVDPARFDNWVADARRVDFLDSEVLTELEQTQKIDVELAKLLQEDEQIKARALEIRQRRMALQNQQRTMAHYRTELRRLRAQNPLLFGDLEDAAKPAAPKSVGVEAPRYITAGGSADPFRLQKVS